MIPTQLTSIQIFAAWALPVLFAVTVHEVAHGYVADLFGDRTARILGRLTLNPIRHIDLLGTIVIPITLLLLGARFIFGWAKPVPINAQNLPHPRRDMAIIAVAGPLANIIMALIWAAIAKGGVIMSLHNLPGAEAIMQMGNAGIQINLILGVLNLLPLPPLDGGHILIGLLPQKMALAVARVAPFGFFILLFLLAVGVLGFLLGPVIALLYGMITFLFGL